jgi:hypothetical protein
MSSDFRMGTCPDCGKVRYRTRADARAARRQLSGDRPRRVYQCGDYWHLTSQDAAERRRFERPDKTRQRKARYKRAKERARTAGAPDDTERDSP